MSKVKVNLAPVTSPVESVTLTMDLQALAGLYALGRSLIASGHPSFRIVDEAVNALPAEVQNAMRSACSGYHSSLGLHSFKEFSS